jgi:hypothetical protein
MSHAWDVGGVRPNEGADGSSGPRYAEPSDGQTEKSAAPEGCLTPSTGCARWSAAGRDVGRRSRQRPPASNT